MNIEVKSDKILRVTIDSERFEDVSSVTGILKLHGRSKLYLCSGALHLQLFGACYFLDIPRCCECGGKIRYDSVVLWNSDKIMVELRCSCSVGMMEVRREDKSR